MVAAHSRHTCHNIIQHTLGSRMNSILPTVSSSWSLTRTVNGRRFSLNAWKPSWSWSPDFMTGMRFPANSMYWGFPSCTCKADSSHSLDNRWVTEKQYKRLVGVLVFKNYGEKPDNRRVTKKQYKRLTGIMVESPKPHPFPLLNIASNISDIILVHSHKTWRHVYNLALHKINIST